MNKLKFAAILGAGAALALSPSYLGAQAEGKPASFGVALQPAPEGATVAEVMPNRSGAALGLQVGDLVLEIGGKPISQEVLQEYMKQKKAGDELTVKVKRAGAILDLTGKALPVPEGAPPPTMQQVSAPAGQPKQ